MTYADASDTSTWAFTRVSRRPQIKGTVRDDPVRGFFAAFNARGRRQPDAPPLQATRLLSIIETPQDPGVALGAITPNAVRTKLQRELNFVAAFNAGAELAAEMVVANETDPPDPEIWKFALGALAHFATLLSPPLVHPLQLGGVSCEWHEQGMNIELRFRALADVYAVIEDARHDLPEFRGRDPEMRRVLAALQLLVGRQA